MLLQRHFYALSRLCLRSVKYWTSVVVWLALSLIKDEILNQKEAIATELDIFATIIITPDDKNCTIESFLYDFETVIFFWWIFHFTKKNLFQPFFCFHVSMPLFSLFLSFRNNVGVVPYVKLLKFLNFLSNVIGHFFCLVILCNSLVLFCRISDVLWLLIDSISFYVIATMCSTFLISEAHDFIAVVNQH